MSLARLATCLLFAGSLSSVSLAARAGEEAPEFLMETRASWLYTTDDPGPDWHRPGYDDTDWLEGLAPFGRPGTPPGGVRTEWRAQEIWMRGAFSISRPALDSIREEGLCCLWIAHDDDVAVYINGQEVLRRRGYVTAYGNHKLPPKSIALLRPGRNVVAVHCRQYYGGQFIDMAIRTTAPRFKVTREEFASTPVSSLLYSHFIELGYGIQVEPMWGGMLFNRSFEPFTPYKPINVDWFDLWNDPTDHSKGYKTDWTQEDWYHSGYEHNDWFACPGSPGPFHIDEDSTFVVETSPLRNVRIALVRGGMGHGSHCMRIVNAEEDQWGGLAQQGKYLHAGRTYRFEGWFRAVNSPCRVELRIYPEGQWEEPLASIPLDEIGTVEFTRQEASFVPESYTGRATLSLWIEPGGEMLADAMRLAPRETFHGWRPEAVEAVREIKPGVMRFPGGCFASFYDWRDGVGPHHKRNPQPSYFWGGYNGNDVGVAELAKFCEGVGAGMMYCVNVHHPLKERYAHYFGEDSYGLMDKRFPQFTGIEEGAREAAALVAYCNLPADAHPEAAKRKEHGYPEPFGIRFWEMDNEVHRWFGALEYAEAVAVYAKAMKAVDPTIEIGMVTYGGRPGEPDYGSQLPAMLEIAGPHVDFLADRRDSEGGLDYMLAHMRAYNEAHGTSIRYCNTEWLAYEGDANDINQYDYEGGITKSFMFSKWHYALNIIKNFLSWQRRGGDVLFVNFSNLANTHSQCVVDTPKEGVYLTASGRAMQVLAESPAAWPLRFDGYEAKVGHEFQVQAAWDRDREKLVLSAVNRTDQAQEITFDIGDLGKTFTSAQRTELWAAGPLVMNTLKHPNAIQRKKSTSTGLAAQETYQVSVPAYSYVETVLVP